MADNKKILAALKDFVVFASDGSLDWEITGEAIRQQLLSDIELSRKSDAVIEAALDALYDKLPVGTGIPTPMVANAVASELSGGNLIAMAEITGKVTDFLDRCPRFQSKRGRSGGLFRVAVKG